MNKKAQVSIFIIIGLVLLLSVGSYLYLNQTKETKRAEAQRPVIEKAPEEFAPVVNYVTNCLYDTAKTAIKLVGERGGNLDVASFKKEFEKHQELSRTASAGS